MSRVQERFQPRDQRRYGGVQTVAHARDFRRGRQFRISSLCRRLVRVESNDVRQQDTHRFTVHDSIMRRERVSGGMGRAQHAVLNRRSRKRGAQQHSPARFDILRVVQDPRKGGHREFERFVREHEGKVVALPGHRRFNRVSDGIDARVRRDQRRL